MKKFCSGAIVCNACNQKPTTKKFRICSALSGPHSCIEAPQATILRLRLIHAQGSLEIRFKPLIIDTKYDIILSRDIIRQYKLIDVFRPFFTESGVRISALSPDFTESSVSGLSKSFETMCQVDEINVHGPNTFRKNADILRELEIDYKTNVFDLAESTPPVSDVLDQITYGDDTILNIELRQLVSEFRDIFSTSVNPAPACDVPPMTLVVDDTKWRVPRASLAPRPISVVKQQELLRQLDVLTRLNVIKPYPEAQHWSQCHFVPKADNTWRFCIDFVHLNSCTVTGNVWPLQNIVVLLGRIGATKPKYFCALDFTSGYWQGPLDPQAVPYTAFITSFGIFAWLRMPMGLKHAGSAFQYMMGTVFAGLIYLILEVYLDDVIVYASNREDIVSRLRKVFERIRRHHMTLHPKKVRLGLSRLEVVGHVISSDGMTLSQEKKDNVFNMPLPKYAKQLKSFIGLANTFHLYIVNLSSKLHILQKMINPYHRQQLLIWNTEASEIFEQIKRDINACPTLYFVDDDYVSNPIFLQSDACQYGIGAILLQLRNGNEPRPIAIMSKALSREQLRWSTIDKECYALFYAVTNWDHLLRDVPFTVQTDHKNIMFTQNDKTGKVRRWLLALQEYDMNVTYIPGANNNVADAFSRLLCPIEEQGEDDVLAALSMTPIEKPLRIPQRYYEYVKRCHNRTIGHGGVDRTLTLLQDYLDRAQIESWPLMRQHVRAFIQRCPCCQKMRTLRPLITVHPYVTWAYNVMDRLAVDTMGPFDEDQRGNKYVIVVIDCFSRFVELYPSPSVGALDAARALVDHAGRYGIPLEIQSDQGSEFVNSLVEAFTNALGVEHITTQARSKEANGLVERSNKEVLRHLRAIIYDRNVITDWSDNLPLVQRIMNSSIHETIGVSPAQILFGNSLELNRGVLHGHADIPTSDPAAPPLRQWMDKMMGNQAHVIRAAQASQLKKETAHLSSVDPESVTSYADGTYVLVVKTNHSLKVGPENKLSLPQSGPYRVDHHEGSTYYLRNLVSGKLESYHIKELRPFHYDETSDNPIEIANRDEQRFVVERILDHRPRVKKVSLLRRASSRLQFLVKWRGYPDSANTWENYHDLRHNVSLHTYLRTNKMKSLLPAIYKDSSETI
jgi:transposase InsO family protein